MDINNVADNMDLSNDAIELDAEDSREVATPETEVDTTKEVETEKEVKTEEPTETQRVSQRINEAKQKAIDDEYKAMYGNDTYEVEGKQVKINSKADYQMVKDYFDRQAQLAELEKQGIDPKILEEAINNNPKVKNADEIITKQQQEEARKQADLKFLEYFKTINEREFDGEKDKFTEEEIKRYQEGESLIDIYKDKALRQALEKNKILEQNQNNKNKAPLKGGVTIHGSDEVASKDDFLEGFDSL